MRRLRAPSQEQAGALVAMAAALFGGWVRLLIPQLAGFPVNDGGLFYVMLRAVLANGLRLPASVQYNGLTIPFAYPPLGFIAGAAAAGIFHIDPIQVLQWLPAAVLVAALPAFYFLARGALGSSWKAGLAALMFAFTPRAITWQIMGGGLTRSFGQLFLILSAAFLYRTFTGYTRRSLLLAILFCTLVVLSHPEAALQTAGIGLLLWLFYGRTRDGVRHALLIGAGTLLLSAAWWLPVVLRTGLGALLSAAQTGHHSLLALLQPLLLNFVDEPLMTLAAVFALIGFAAQASKREWLLPAWLFLPFLLEPRSAPNASMVPLAMLAAVALSDVILPALASLEGRLSAAQENVLRSRAALLFLLFTAVYMLGSTSLYASQVAGTRLSPADRQAFAWVRASTPADAKFLVLTGGTAQELFCDAPLEWFPALAERVSLTTIQGREWQQGQDFGPFTAAARELSRCLSADSPLDCVESASSSENVVLPFDYLYVARRSPELSGCRLTGTSAPGERLVEQLRASSRFAVAYETEAVAVFHRAASR